MTRQMVFIYRDAYKLAVTHYIHVELSPSLNIHQGTLNSSL